MEGWGYGPPPPSGVNRRNKYRSGKLEIKAEIDDFKAHLLTLQEQKDMSRRAAGGPSEAAS